MKHVDPATRAVLVARLREKRAAGGSISAEVRRAADGLLVSTSTVWRWLATDPEDDSTPGPDAASARTRYVLNQADRDGYADWGGNVAALWRDRVARGVPVPPLRTLQRAFARELRPGERAAATDGVAGRRRHEVYLRWEPVCRNARWEADHKELPVLVTPPRGARPMKPWMTAFLDCYSRLIMGWALSLRPDAATVLAALRRGLVVDAARGPFGGVPRVLVPDNGLEFATTALERVCATLGTTFDPTDGYAPHQKGKIERANLTVDQEFLSGLPFNTEGPRAADGRLYGPDVAPMTLAAFVDRFDQWVTDYNTVRAHSALDGQTPLQRWQSDPTPIQEIPGEQLRWLLLADCERTIQRDGVHFHGHTFIAGELNGRVGEQVQVRYTPHDYRQIEIFRADIWLCTAYPQGALTDEQREQVLARRRADAAELGRRQRRTSRRARTRLAPMTAPGEPEEVTVIDADEARSERRGRDGGERDIDARDRDLQRLARTDLLNLHRDFDYWNPPEPADPAASATTPEGDHR
ncbi:Mu transposase C-terminal domain-containing protein [Pseudonocardia sp. RS010]|uniref:Mu transposase C-terminal domain-containing protein n=1 Tax=Pseudonocardia sp. RS010 TaxID=3385979 RepID=UPI0039A169C2